MQKTYKAPALRFPTLEALGDSKTLKKKKERKEENKHKVHRVQQKQLTEWWVGMGLGEGGKYFRQGVRKVLFEKVIVELGHEGWGHKEQMEKHSYRGNNNCKVPEAATILACAWNSKRLHVARAQQKGRVHEVRSEVSQAWRPVVVSVDGQLSLEHVFLEVTSSSSSSNP